MTFAQNASNRVKEQGLEIPLVSADWAGSPTYYVILDDRPFAYGGDYEMTKKNKKIRPKAGVKDVAHTIAKASISAIPVFGGPAAEIFSAIIVPPLSKRRDEWIESIVEGLKGLEKEVKGFKIEELSKKETFITTVMHASQAAIRNHQEEKLEALRNAVLNAALPNSPEEDMQLMFLNFVDLLTPWHLRILKLFQNPQEWAQKQGTDYSDRITGSPSVVLEDAFPELCGRDEFCGLLVKDLYSRGLMNGDTLKGMMSIQGMLASRTTSMGNQFIEFITSPFKEGNTEPA